MYSSIADIIILALFISIISLSIVKVVWFTKQRKDTDHLMCLLYFPGIDILFTSDTQSKFKKKRQNNLTAIIMALSIVLLLLVKIFYGIF